MLSFELKQSQTFPNEAELEVYCDREGLNALLAQLLLLSDGRTDHVHLMTETWGGTHLDEVPQGQKNLPVHHVKILLRQASTAE